MSDTPPLRTPEWSGVVIKKWVGSEQTDDAPLPLLLSSFLLLIDGHISVLVNWFRSLSSRTFCITVVR